MLATANGLLKEYAALAAAIGAVLVLVIRPLIERWLLARLAWSAIGAETGDVKRHLERNLARVAEMVRIINGGKSVPQRNHVQKLAVMESLTLFSDDALKHLSANRVRVVHRARVRLRNLNLDIAEALRQHDQAEWDQLALMLGYLDRLHIRLIPWALHMLEDDDTVPPGVGILAKPR